MKPFEELYFSQLIAKKLHEGNLSQEENEYVNTYLLSEDPAVSARCREIISGLLEKQPPSTLRSGMTSSELNKEYQQFFAKLKSKKKKGLLFLILTVILAVLLLALAFILLP